MSESFQGWAIVELMGYRQLSGRISEVEMGGTVFLRLDVAMKAGYMLEAVTQFYPAHAIYCITYCDEKTVNSMIDENKAQLASVVKLPHPEDVLTSEDYDKAFPDDAICHFKER